MIAIDYDRNCRDYDSRNYGHVENMLENMLRWLSDNCEGKVIAFCKKYVGYDSIWLETRYWTKKKKESWCENNMRKIRCETTTLELSFGKVDVKGKEWNGAWHVFHML